MGRKGDGWLADRVIREGLISNQVKLLVRYGPVKDTGLQLTPSFVLNMFPLIICFYIQLAY
jgi:hypothetical protein